MKQEKRKIFSNEDNFDIIKLYIVKSRLWRDKRVVISRKWVISNEMDTGSRGPRARSASGLITHASWRIINISRLVHAKTRWSCQVKRETSRPWEGTAERGSHFHLLSIRSRSLRDRESNSNRTRDRWIDRWLAFPRNLAPTLAEACLVQCLGATTFEYRFPYAPLQSRENRSLVRI